MCERVCEQDREKATFSFPSDLLAHGASCSSDAGLLSFLLLLQAHVLCGGAGLAGGGRLQQEGEAQAASGRPALLTPVSVGDHQPPVVLRRSGAQGSSVGFAEARRVPAGLAGVVFMEKEQVGCGDTATLDVRRLAVRVAVLLINVFTELPPLPLFQHL